MNIITRCSTVIRGRCLRIPVAKTGDRSVGNPNVDTTGKQHAVRGSRLA